MLHTVSYPQLDIQFQYDEQRNVVGFDKIGSVWCSRSSIDAHNEEMQKFADERNGGDIGRIVRYDSYGKIEWYAAPDLKVFWSSDWE